MAARRRFQPGRLRLLSGAERHREGGLQPRRLPERQRLSRRLPRAPGLERDAQAARAVSAGQEAFAHAATGGAGGQLAEGGAASLARRVIGGRRSTTFWV